MARPIVFFLMIVFSVPVFAGQSTGSDSLKKHTAAEKTLDVDEIALNMSREQDVYLYNLENTSASLQDLENASTSSARDNESKRYLLFNTLMSLTNKEDKLQRQFYKTLKISGYADTVNHLFFDYINFVNLSVKINRINFYTLGGAKNSKQQARLKLYVKWKFKNSFDEPIGEADTEGFSGNYTSENFSVVDYFESNPEKLRQMVFEAFTAAFINLQANAAFTKAMVYNTDYTITDSVLVLPAPTAVITSKADAAEACVMLRNDETHGSGFVITTNGYIISSYNAIEETAKKKEDSTTIKVITASGEELKGKIVRFNRFRNVALVKVDKAFEKVFKIPSEKTFKVLQNVFTIGTPKSVELGQSLSAGIISAERKVNNNYYIQMNMSINSGNSGGPLFDESGALQGMVVARLSGKNTEGVSFAVPAILLEHYLKLKFR